ncbi:MAG: hypothetical protein ABIG68_14935 [Acidobacteriota bacterium]
MTDITTAPEVPFLTRRTALLEVPHLAAFVIVLFRFGFLFRGVDSKAPRLRC